MAIVAILLFEGREKRAAIEGAEEEHGGAEREHIDEISVSGRAKRRHFSQLAVTYWPGFGEVIYLQKAPPQALRGAPTPGSTRAALRIPSPATRERKAALTPVPKRGEAGAD